MNEKREFKRGITRRLLHYIRPYRGYVVGATIFSLLYVAFVLVGPVLYGKAIDAMVGAGNVDFEAVYAMTAGFAACVLAAFVSQKLLGNCVNTLCYRLVRDLRKDAFASLTAARIRYIDTHAQGDVIARVVNDVDIISDGLLQGVAQLFTGVMTILATLVVMFVINYIVALVVVVLTPLSLFVAAFITKRTFKSFSRQVKVQGKLAAHVKEMLGGQKAVILFNQEAKSCKKFAEIDAHLYQIGWCQRGHLRLCGRFGGGVLHPQRRRHPAFGRLRAERVHRRHAVRLPQLRQPVHQALQRGVQRRHPAAKRLRLRRARV